MDIEELEEEIGLWEMMLKDVDIANQAKDNLFSANHRNKMIQAYNYTEAQTVTIEELL